MRCLCLNCTIIFLCQSVAIAICLKIQSVQGMHKGPVWYEMSIAASFWASFIREGDAKRNANLRSRSTCFPSHILSGCGIAGVWSNSIYTSSPGPSAVPSIRFSHINRADFSIYLENIMGSCKSSEICPSARTWSSFGYRFRRSML